MCAVYGCHYLAGSQGLGHQMWMHSKGCVVVHEPKDEGVGEGLGLATPLWGAMKLLMHVKGVYSGDAGWSHVCRLVAGGGLLIRVVA